MRNLSVAFWLFFKGENAVNRIAQRRAVRYWISYVGAAALIRLTFGLLARHRSLRSNFSILILLLLSWGNPSAAQSIGNFFNIRPDCDYIRDYVYCSEIVIGSMRGAETAGLDLTNLVVGERYIFTFDFEHFANGAGGSGYWNVEIVGISTTRTQSINFSPSTYTQSISFTATASTHRLVFTPFSDGMTTYLGARATSLVVDAPTVTSVSSSTANGHYKAGDVISISVNFSESVIVTGSPTLTLETGAIDRAATYLSGSGSSTLVFSYTVQAGDTAADLDYVPTSPLGLSGGTIRSTSAVNAVLTLPPPAAADSLAANKAIVIDTTAPTVTDAGLSISGASGTGGAFRIGDTITASWETSGSDGDTNITASLGGATVDFSAFGGGSAVPATLSGTKWTATYTIVANTSISGSNLNVSVTATDKAGNFATAADTSSATVDANSPVVTAANISLSGASGTGGAFKIGDTVTATWDNTASGDNNGDIASVSVDFTEFGGGSAVAASNSGGAWTATYTLLPGAIDATGRNVTVTATDTSGNRTAQLDNENASVDNIAPIVTSGEISVTGQTGNPNNTVFKIGDTVSVSWDNSNSGDNNADTISSVTVDFSDFGGGAAVAATNSAGVWTATYEYPAGAIVGSNYGVSVTVLDNAGNRTTTNDDEQLRLDNVQTAQPSITQIEDGDNSGSISDTITNVTKPTIRGTAEASTRIDVYVAGILVGQTTTNGTGAWSYTFTTDLREGDNSISATATDAVGNTSAPSTPYNITVDITPPAKPPAPDLDPAGNTGSVSDLITSNSTPPVSGTVEPNSTVQIFVGNVRVGTVAADSNGDWSFALPDGSLTEGDNAITLTSTDVAANVSPPSNALTVTVDTTAPNIAIADPLMGDNLFNAAEASSVTLSGTTTDVNDGQSVTLRVSDGSTTLSFTTTVSRNAWTRSVDLSSLSDGPLTITADVTDVAGNAATQASHTIAKDIVYPSVEVSGPTEIVTAAFDVTISFSEVVFGFDLDDVTVAEGTATAITGAGDIYTVTIDPVLGETVQVSVVAGVAADESDNPNLQSNIFQVQAGSPASEFEKYRAEIRQVLVDEAERSLRSGLSSNQRMVRGARGRFVEAQREQADCSEDDTASGTEETCDVGQASQTSVPFDVDGSLELNGATLSARGSFFEQTGNDEGTQRRLFFGDYDVQRHSDTGSSTATLTARVAWEQMTNDTTMLGYFIGAELASSNMNGAFEGRQDKIGVTIGAYAVHHLAEQVYLDGFLSLGAGRNDLEMANDVLALSSDYTTRTAAIGAALSGVYDYAQYEFRPELSVSYGHTRIGTVGFTGHAYGLVDTTLRLNAGNVSVANLVFRPEVIWGLDAGTVAESNSQLSFAPRMICEQTRATHDTEGCGGGAELGLNTRSSDGLTNAEFRVMTDRVGSSERTSYAIGLEHRF